MNSIQIYLKGFRSHLIVTMNEKNRKTDTHTIAGYDRKGNTFEYEAFGNTTRSFMCDEKLKATFADAWEYLGHDPSDPNGPASVFDMMVKLNLFPLGEIDE